MGGLLCARRTARAREGGGRARGEGGEERREGAARKGGEGGGGGCEPEYMLKKPPCAVFIKQSRRPVNCGLPLPTSDARRVRA